MIIINARFLTQPITGVQRYAIELSKALKQKQFEALWLTPHNIIHTDLAKTLQAKVIGTKKGHAWEQIELPRYLKTLKTPLLLNLANTAPILYPNKITAIHDIAYKRYPKSFSRAFRAAYGLATPIIIKTSKALITVSQFSKKEIQDYYKVDSTKIHIVHNAVSTQFHPLTQRKQNKPQYLLAVSSWHYQKNFHGLIEAFNKIKQADCQLYLIGEKNTSFSNQPQLKQSERVQYLGRVTDDELITYYQNAQAFIYPSYYEGFGIPPLEAQACGCPCVISNAASLPEVGGDSVIYCDPHDPQDIAKKIDTLLNDPTLQQSLVKKGFQNIKRFDWMDSAEKIIQLIKENA